MRAEEEKEYRQRRSGTLSSSKGRRILTWSGTDSIRLCRSLPQQGLFSPVKRKHPPCKKASTGVRHDWILLIRGSPALYYYRRPDSTRPRQIKENPRATRWSLADGNFPPHMGNNKNQKYNSNKSKRKRKKERWELELVIGGKRRLEGTGIFFRFGLSGPIRTMVEYWPGGDTVIRNKHTVSSVRMYPGLQRYFFRLTDQGRHMEYMTDSYLTTGVLNTGQWKILAYGRTESGSINRWT